MVRAEEYGIREYFFSQKLLPVTCPDRSQGAIQIYSSDKSINDAKSDTLFCKKWFDKPNKDSAPGRLLMPAFEVRGPESELPYLRIKEPGWLFFSSFGSMPCSFTDQPFWYRVTTQAQVMLQSDLAPWHTLKSEMRNFKKKTDL